ncbi:hypothetical protein MH215_22375 [Paenibacillus sp. ACRSA]|uniref:hypothetical protein n=1 Tax=Paenibacillus sp. ACRSA TaxID=2918211 RepID=UPI001EF5CEF3|nr:hypothetical protein [Paenibacillus sp. ACRSA]MCG7379752.1 hypothetical protein [Paenibacillus sp. ACRSA]
MAQPSYFIAVTLLDKRREFVKLVEGQEHGLIEVAILPDFLFYRYKFLSRLPEWTRIAEGKKEFTLLQRANKLT